MNYSIFLVTNTHYFYPRQVINLLNELGSSSVAITINKENLFSKCRESIFIERIQSTGRLENTSQLIEYVKKANPQAVVLDDCFWDDTEKNTSLLENLFLLQQIIPFRLVNVLPISVFLHNRTKKIIRLDKATHLYYPESRINEVPWSVMFGSTTIYYKNSSLEIVDGYLDLFFKEPSIYKTAYRLFKGMRSIQLRNDLDLFNSFLESLRVKQPNKHLLHFILTVYKYLFDTSGEQKNRKDLHFFEINNELFERLNQPVLFLIEYNRDIFDEIISFFEETI